MSLFDLPPVESARTPPASERTRPRGRKASHSPTLDIAWACERCGGRTEEAGVCLDCKHDEWKAGQFEWNQALTMRLELGEDVWCSLLDENGMMLWPLDDNDRYETVVARAEAAGDPAGRNWRLWLPEHRRAHDEAVLWGYSHTRKATVPAEVWGLPYDGRAPDGWTAEPMPEEVPIVRWVEWFDFEDADWIDDGWVNEHGEPSGVWFPYPARPIELVEVGSYL